MKIPTYKDNRVIGLLLMGNIINQIKDVATIHDAAVDAGIVENEKVGKYIPNQFSTGSTANTIASIARASSHAKRVKNVAINTVFLGATLAGSYIAMNRTKEVAISARNCKTIALISENLTIKNKFNSLFQYHKDNHKKQSKYTETNKKSLVDIVKDKNLSVK